MDCLIQRNNIWPQIKSTLEKQEAIKPYLTLRCQNHPDQYTQVKDANDFLPISEGGCTIQCGRNLQCGHVCKSLCHIIDRNHLEYRCKEPCEMILCEIGHKCPDLCYQDCSACMVQVEVVLPCEHKHMRPCHENPDDFNCPVLVNVELECGHKADKPCYRDIETFPCPHPCEIRKLCGHQCERRCHINKDPDHLLDQCMKPCERFLANCSTKTHPCPLPCYDNCQPCETNVKKVRECGHMHQVPCSEDVNKIRCDKRCTKTMVCGHKCRLKCSEPCGNCKEMVLKTHELCGHEIKAKCSEKPNRKNCAGKCPLLLSCGHPCQGKCNTICNQYCKFLIDCPIKPACRHVFKIPCSKRNITDPYSYEILKYCLEPCGATLNCKHPCSGNCGKCVQGRIHKSCTQACGVTLICGHPCAIPCRETCRPCQKKCTYYCVHSRCGKKCGEPCAPCKEPCKRRCEHVRCTKRCGDMCDIDPCGMPCQKKLRCKHPCIGFCGEPCPPVCRICDPVNEIFEIYFGNEDEPDARFIYLEECGHVIESKAMDQWIQQSCEEINVKTCPKCKTTITKTLRYSNVIKKAYIDIVDVKKKQFGSQKDNEVLRTTLLYKLRILLSDTITKKAMEKSYYFNAVAQQISTNLQEVRKGKRQALDIQDLQTSQSQLEIFSRIINIYKKCSSYVHAKEKCLNHATFLLEILFKQYNRITSQEILDFQLELTRYEKYVKLYNIEAEPAFGVVSEQEDAKTYYTEILSLMNTLEKYSDETNEILEKLLNNLRELVNKCMVVTPEEKQMIHKALGMAQGHWFKCPNGHTYCITECGGAMEESKCNECGEAIGGTHHRLLSSNAHDGSMDGSQFAAWSTQTNMRNYII